VSKVLENPKKDQVAIKVPIEGDFKGVKTNITETIWELLRNAFIQALADYRLSSTVVSCGGRSTGERFKRRNR
jgi:hypothetical protein